MKKIKKLIYKVLLPTICLGSLLFIMNLDKDSTLMDKQVIHMKQRFHSQWSSSIEPEKSCGLSILTNVLNLKLNTDYTLDQIRKMYLPDYKGFYTMEKLGEYLKEGGVNYNKIDLNEYYLDKLQHNNIVMCIDNAFIKYYPTEHNRPIGKSYDEDFKHYILAIGTQRYKEQDYVIVYDPFESDNNFRMYDIRQLKYAINNNCEYGYVIEK